MKTASQSHCHPVALVLIAVASCANPPLNRPTAPAPPATPCPPAIAPPSSSPPAQPTPPPVARTPGPFEICPPHKDKLDPSKVSLEIAGHGVVPNVTPTSTFLKPHHEHPSCFGVNVSELAERLAKQNVSPHARLNIRYRGDGLTLSGRAALSLLGSRMVSYARARAKGRVVAWAGKHIDVTSAISARQRVVPADTVCWNHQRAPADCSASNVAERIQRYHGTKTAVVRNRSAVTMHCTPYHAGRTGTIWGRGANIASGKSARISITLKPPQSFHHNSLSIRCEPEQGKWPEAASAVLVDLAEIPTTAFFVGVEMHFYPDGKHSINAQLFLPP